YEQVKRINELLPRVPDAHLRVPRDTLRVGAARAALWAGHVDEGLADLQALKDECRRRAPPAQRLLAWCSAVEGHWRLWKGEPASAEAQLTEALRLTATGPPDQDGILLNYFVRGYLARALSDRGAWAEAEEVARAGLLPPSKVTSKVTPDLVYLHYFMLLEITGTLCRQTRFAEAESLLQTHRRELAATGCPPRVLLALQKESGKVLARAGKASEALPILMSVATSALGTSSDCADAAFVALGSGDLDRYRQLCALGLARFAAGAEGIGALGLADMLLGAPQDTVVTQAADELVKRVEQARDFSREWSLGTREWLEFRQGRPAGAAALGPSPPPCRRRLRPLAHASASRTSAVRLSLSGARLPWPSRVAPTKRARPLPAGSRALGQPHRRNNRAIWARVVRGGISPMHTAAKRSSCSRRK